MKRPPWDVDGAHIADWAGFAGRSLSIRPLFEMLDGHKTKLMMTKLQDEEAEAAPEEAAAEGGDAAAGGADVSFPEDYPNSVRVLAASRIGGAKQAKMSLGLSRTRRAGSLVHSSSFPMSELCLSQRIAMSEVVHPLGEWTVSPSCGV